MPVHAVRPCRFLLALVLAAVVALVTMPATRALAAGRPAAHAAAHHHRHAAVAPNPSASSASSPAGCADANLLPTASNLDRIAAATFCLINGDRTARGLRSLRIDAAMAGAALGHSEDMVANGYFAHNSPTGRDPLQRLRTAGYAGSSVGENIAAASGSLATPAAIVRMWMNSPGHRTNILNPAYRDTGLGVAAGAASLSASGATYTEDFGATS